MKTAFQELINRRRTVRRFSQQQVPRQNLVTLVDWARLAPSAANRQPLVYVAVDDPDLAKRIFGCLQFAAYLGAEGRPHPGEEPTAYIITCLRNDLDWPEAARDVGAAAMTICLGACALGLGACMMRSADRDQVAALIGLPPNIMVDSVIALGWPASAPLVENMSGEDDFRYWRDDMGIHHVPKRPLARVISFNSYGTRLE